MPGVHVANIAMHDHASILIWNVHTCMGHIIVPCTYKTFHMYMGQYTHMGQNVT